MEFLHVCVFCGWRRAAATAVVIPAGCPECGCAVDSLDASEAAPQQVATEMRLPDSRTLRAFLCLAVLAFVYMAARTGSAVLGAPGAIIALGAAGFLLLPFVPERLPAKRR